MTAHRNALSNELSPYLQQHAGNPVDWLPWGESAFALARERDKPILLSIGYSACHWCHVMAHESFEDPQVAALMNEEFVNVKVDREERPDVDAVYMKAVQALTGSGGWPLTAVLTPDGRPFYGGTYFPPVARHGLPAFTTVLRALAAAWRERRSEVEDSADKISEYLRASEAGPGSEPQRPPPVGIAASSPELALDEALGLLEAAEDRLNGGFGGAPKFPPHSLLTLLLAAPLEGDARVRARGMAQRTLDAILKGGVRDHLGGGFFRYSVDAGWRVPHFEKMLYDNAQLLTNLALAAVELPGGEYRAAADELVAWLKREMTQTTEAGAAFCSALDADSPGPGGRPAEGAFYTWSTEELRTLTREAFDVVTARYGIGAVGELEGLHVLRLAASEHDLTATAGLAAEELERLLRAAKRALFDARDTRPRPAVDDKVLSSWNGLTMRALAVAGVKLDRPEWLELALANARFLRSELYRDGRLLHVWRAGSARVEGLLEDYAYVGLGLIELYRATLEPWLLSWAFELADAVDARFAAPEGGYFNTAHDAETLLTRPRGLVDAATPAENTAAAELVWWTGRYRSDAASQQRAHQAVGGLREAALALPQPFASTLALLARFQAQGRELVVVGGGAAAAALTQVWRESSTSRSGAAAAGDVVVLHVTGAAHPLAHLPLLAGRLGEVESDGAGRSAVSAATAYLCQGGACQLPALTPDELRRQFGRSS